MTANTHTTSDQLVIDIDGMSCGSCVEHVRSALSTVTGVQVDSVSPGRAVVTVRGTTNERDIRDAVAHAGYEVRHVGRADAAPAPQEHGRVARTGGCCGGGSAHAATPAAIDRR